MDDDGESRYAAATAGDSNAIVDWEKLAGDIELNYEAIHHTVTVYSEHNIEFIKSKLANEDILFKVNGDEETALHLGARRKHRDVVEVLISAARLLALGSASANDIHPSHPISLLDDFIWHPNRYKETALHLVLTNDDWRIGKMLVSASPPRYGHDLRNYLGETPVYLAVKLGHEWAVCVMCECWKGRVPLEGPDAFTPALHAAIIKFRPVREHQWEAVETIFAEDPAYQNGRVRKIKDLKYLISPAAQKLEKGFTYIVNQIIAKGYEARRDIKHPGQTDLHAAIIKRDEESVFRLLRQDDEIVSKADSEYWTPLHYAAYYDFYSILEATHIGYKPQEYLSANQIWWVPTPLHVAAKEGYTCTLIKLMELLPADLYVAADSITHQNILHLAVLSSKKEMIVHIIKKCPEEHIDKMLNQQDVNGDTPLHLLIRDGCFVPELIKHKEIDRMVKNGQYWTSFDMLYFKDQIIADQVKIKKALDDFQADQHPKIIWQYFRFWRGSMEKKSKMLESLVPPSKRTTKDNEFKKAKKLLMKENLIQMKDELDRYRQRTNTQIIVTALITTVTFTVGFTMPGGYNQDGDLKGMVILSEKKSFIAFMVSDALALLLSTSSLFLYFIASMYEDPRSVSKLNDASTVLNIVSVIAMMLTFITGTYVVLSHSRALAYTVIVISCFFFLLVVIGLLIKWKYDRKQEMMHEV
ncbi:uncharacterized protein LOC141692043 isoform X2 [Apium graveolens]|uniref:uncharacterized protein LOC141692043 isoform X2 n=1 Tax=Apium graveolens TaxID=4045 RepID=UPI003D7BB04F